MNILITSLIPEDKCPKFLAEALLNCEVDLSTPANPEGKDNSVDETVLATVVPGYVAVHNVEMVSVLEAIGRRHGAQKEDLIRQQIVSEYGVQHLMGCMSIPLANCREMEEEKSPATS